TWRSESGVPFTGHAWRRIRGAMRNGVRRERMHAGLVAKADAAAYDYAEGQGDAGDPFQDAADERLGQGGAAFAGCAAAFAKGLCADIGRLSAEEQLIARQEYARALTAIAEAEATLPGRDKVVIDLRYRREMGFEGIAGELGVTYISARRY